MVQSDNIVCRRHGKPNVGHGPSAFDVQAIADADGRRDEDAEQPGSAQTGAVGVVRRDQAGVHEAGRGRAQRTDVCRRRWRSGGDRVVAARARRRRIGTAVPELRLVRRHRLQHVVRRPGRPGRLPRGAVVQAPAVPPAAVVRRKGAGRRVLRPLRLFGGAVQDEQVVVRRGEP